MGSNRANLMKPVIVQDYSSHLKTLEWNFKIILEYKGGGKENYIRNKEIISHIKYKIFLLKNNKN